MPSIKFWSKWGAATYYLAAAIFEVIVFATFKAFAIISLSWTFLPICIGLFLSILFFARWMQGKLMSLFPSASTLP